MAWAGGRGEGWSAPVGGPPTVWQAGSELIGPHFLIQPSGQAFGILVLEMSSLIWMHEKFKEVRYLVHAFMLGSWKSNPGLSNCLACALNAFLDFLLVLG